MEIDNKKMWESILRQMPHNKFLECSIVSDKIIKNALKEQGFEWRNDKIVKPAKYKVGDFVKHSYHPEIDYQVEKKFDDGSYRIVPLNKSKGGMAITSATEDFMRLWSIKDAKDGDILACESGWTCIFKSINKDFKDSFCSYCFMDKDGWFCSKGSNTHTTDERINGKLYPATKEQRELLFSRMKEAGYEWDADKKELKKIESSIPEIVDEHFDEMIDGNCQQQSLTEFEKAVRDVITTELCNNFGNMSFGVSISDMEARLIASKILPAARKQIASEINKYDMSDKYFRNIKERFRYDSYFYEEGILDTLNIIKGE